MAVTQGSSGASVSAGAFAIGRAPIFFMIALLMSLPGCTRPASDVPAWPEQPSPSYPDPSEEGRPQTSNDAADDSTADSGERSPKEPKRSHDSHALAKRYRGAEAKQTLSGQATYYADSLAGNQTASGEVYDPKEHTAAHKKLPFGTVVRVIRTDTSQETYVRINDRGPFGSADRIIDVSRIAAEELEMIRAGVVPVRVEILEQPED